MSDAKHKSNYYFVGYPNVKGSTHTQISRTKLANLTFISLFWTCLQNATFNLRIFRVSISVCPLMYFRSWLHACVLNRFCQILQMLSLLRGTLLIWISMVFVSSKDKEKETERFWTTLLWVIVQDMEERQRFAVTNYDVASGCVWMQKCL